MHSWVPRHHKLLLEVYENLWKITVPLKKLLKKNSFKCNEETKHALSNLKQSMCTTLILAMSYFTKPFVLKCDALGIGLGNILTQEGRPLTFTSK